MIKLWDERQNFVMSNDREIEAIEVRGWEKMCECGKQTERRCHNPPEWQFTAPGCLWACRPVSER